MAAAHSSSYSKKEKEKLLLSFSLHYLIVGSAGELRYFSKECDSIVCRRCWSDTSNFFFFWSTPHPLGTVCTPFWRTGGNLLRARSLREREKITHAKSINKTLRALVVFLYCVKVFSSWLAQSPKLQTCFYFLCVAVVSRFFFCL